MGDRVKSQLAKSQVRAGYLFITPALVLYAVFLLAPVIVTIILSFARYDFLTGARWAGISNYLALMTDRRFLKTLLNTFQFTIFAVAGNVGVGLLLALALNRAMPRPLLYFFRLAFFLPVIIAGAFVSIVWSFFLRDELGVINYYLSVFGIPNVRWLTSNDMALWSVIIVDVWKNTGFFMIIFIAALQGVPRNIIDAATMDGASPWRRFWKITFPYISPVVFLNVILASIGALQVFEIIVILTRGGPGDATRSVSLYLTEQSFSNFDFSYGAAIAVVLMLIVLTITLIQFAVSKLWVR